jgi:hypothetical protein
MFWTWHAGIDGRFCPRITALKKDNAGITQGLLYLLWTQFLEQKLRKLSDFFFKSFLKKILFVKKLEIIIRIIQKHF